MTYILPDENEMHPGIYYHRCLNFPEHAHLKDGEPTVEFLYRAIPVIQAGRQVLGAVHLPSVQGKLSDLFDWMLLRLFGALPDFLIILDEEYWLSCGDKHREILMHHEMCHCIHKEDKWGSPRFGKEGQPVWGLRGHDVEEFNLVVRRYGAYSEEVQKFMAAVRQYETEHGQPPIR
jgi:hypothetical protein